MNSSCCRDMQSGRFSLSGRAPETFAAAPQSDTLWLDYEGRVPEKAVAKNAVVYPGMLLARHPDPGAGDLRCPVIGVVSDAGTQGVLITVGMPAPKKGEDGAKAEAPEIPVTAPVDLGALRGEELAGALKELGIHTSLLTRPCSTLVVNALNPEPGIAWAEPLFGGQSEVIAAGIALLRRVSPAEKFVMVVGQGAQASFADVEIRSVPAVYPESLDPLVIKAATGKECPDDACAVGLHEVWKLGRVALSGLPVTETVLTLNDVNYIVPVGTPARALLEQAGLSLHEGDTLVFGGPLRGAAQTRPQAGVTPDTYGICVVRRDDVPPLEGDAACISCNECVYVCPSRIQPGLISRLAELGLDAKCRELHIDACMDCGLCTYVCIARRPVLQYLRLARGRLNG